HDRILAGMKALQDLLALLGFALVRDCGDQESARDTVNRGVVGGENQDAIALMLVEQFLKLGQLGRRSALDSLLLPKRLERRAALRGSAASDDEFLPARWTAE